MFNKNVTPETLWDNIEKEIETDIEIDQYQYESADYSHNLHQYRRRPFRFRRPFFPFFPFFPHRRHHFHRRHPRY